MPEELQEGAAGPESAQPCRAGASPDARAAGGVGQSQGRGRREAESPEKRRAGSEQSQRWLSPWRQPDGVWHLRGCRAPFRSRTVPGLSARGQGLETHRGQSSSGRAGEIHGMQEEYPLEGTVRSRVGARSCQAASEQDRAPPCSLLLVPPLQSSPASPCSSQPCSPALQPPSCGEGPQKPFLCPFSSSSQGARGARGAQKGVCSWRCGGNVPTPRGSQGSPWPLAHSLRGWGRDWKGKSLKKWLVRRIGDL